MTRRRNPASAAACGDPAKRAFDVVVGFVILVVSAPLMAVIALTIRLESRGGALFRQQRVGLGGEVFRIHKFRTMRSDASGALVSTTRDPRITRIGAVLRRSKLDELPQVLDVLRGDMSLVGPRPEVMRYVALWPDTARQRILSVRPGITDPASLILRNEADELTAAEDAEKHYVESLLPRKTAMYVDYVANRSFQGDLRILLNTVRCVIWNYQRS